LLDNQLDLILVALPYDLPGTTVLPLFRDRFLLACRDNTERVDPDNYRFRQIEAGSVILLEDGHCLRDHALDACKLRGTEKINRFSASSLLTLIEMIDADLGISYLPEIAAGSSLLRNTRVSLHPLQDKNYRTIGLAWRKGSTREAEFRLLGELLQSGQPDSN
jgi:LysR family hydrogen peroxide-inducible transcriptional activator